jgi:hypothetical protein
MIGRAVCVIVALAISLVMAACSQVPISTSSPASSPIPTSASSASLVVPTLSPTPPTGGLGDWHQLAPQNGLRDVAFMSVASEGDTFLGLGCFRAEEGCGQPGIWESEDGLNWRTAGPVFLPPDFTFGTVFAAASSRIGTVAAGNVRRGDNITQGLETQASIWLRSADGWLQVTPQSASDATVNALLATDGRVVAVGSRAFIEQGGFRAWWSADGTTWQSTRSFNTEPNPTALLQVAAGLLAWGPSCSVCVARTAWWLSVDGTEWQPIDPPRGLQGANVTAIGLTQGGFEAFGTLGGGNLPVRAAAWVADETAADWRVAEPPAQPEALNLRYHLPVGHGSVVAGIGPPGPGREQQTGLIWLRGPGESTWRAPVEAPDLEIVGLIQHPQELNRIIAIGRTFQGLRETVSIWTGLVDWAP